MTLTATPAVEYPFLHMTPKSFRAAEWFGECWHAATVHGSWHDFRVYHAPLPPEARTDHRSHAWVVVVVPTKHRRTPGWKKAKTLVIVVSPAEWDDDLTGNSQRPATELATRLAVADIHIVVQEAPTDIAPHVGRLLVWREEEVYGEPLDFDAAEAAGFDGTGRDGDPRFPYTTADVCSACGNRLDRPLAVEDCPTNFHAHN